MGWVQENGRWVKQPDSRPRSSGGPPLKLSSPAPLEMTEPTAAFVKQPLEFMKRYPLQPANGSVTDGVVTMEWAIDEADIIGMNDDGLGNILLTNPLYRINRHTKIKQLTGQRIKFFGGPRYMSFRRSGSIYGQGANSSKFIGKPGEVTPLLGENSDILGYLGVPVWWLPWASYKITEFQIPPVPSNLVDPSEDEYPRFFLTASINGCSVFVRGDATSPTIFHAGVADKIRGGDAGAFWARQMRMAQTGFDTATISGAVHKDEYMQFANGPETIAAKNYIDWLKEGEIDGRPLEIKIISGYGCVFGVRFGRFWSFYLQEILYTESKKFYKRSDLKKNSDGNYIAPGNVRVVATSKMVPGKFFGTKNSKIFTSTSVTSMPLKVVEIFPNRHWAGSVGGHRVAATRL